MDFYQTTMILQRFWKGEKGNNDNNNINAIRTTNENNDETKERKHSFSSSKKHHHILNEHFNINLITIGISLAFPNPNSQRESIVTKRIFFTIYQA